MTEMSREKAERVVRETTEKAIAVMRHFTSGAEIQVQYKDPGCDEPVGWLDAICPVWDWFECEYRIKPKPREFWAGLDETGRAIGITPAINSGSIPSYWGSTIKVREVIE